MKRKNSDGHRAGLAPITTPDVEEALLERAKQSHALDEDDALTEQAAPFGVKAVGEVQHINICCKGTNTDLGSPIRLGDANYASATADSCAHACCLQYGMVVRGITVTRAGYGHGSVDGTCYCKSEGSAKYMTEHYGVNRFLDSHDVVCQAQPTAPPTPLPTKPTPAPTPACPSPDMAVIDEKDGLCKHALTDEVIRDMCCNEAALLERATTEQAANRSISLDAWREHSYGVSFAETKDIQANDLDQAVSRKGDSNPRRRAPPPSRRRRAYTGGFTDVGAAKCGVNGRDPASSYHHQQGPRCRDMCANDQHCQGYSISHFNNCLLFHECGLSATGIQWGNAHCHVKPPCVDRPTPTPTAQPTAQPTALPTPLPTEPTPAPTPACPSPDMALIDEKDGSCKHGLTDEILRDACCKR